MYSGPTSVCRAVFQTFSLRFLPGSSVLFLFPSNDNPTNNMLSVLLMVLVAGGSGAVVTVTASDGNIKAAIAAAFPGDTVRVFRGTYVGSSNCDLVIEKDLVLEAPDGRDRTIIDCQLRSRCLTILNGARVTISGFSFVNGRAPLASARSFAVKILLVYFLLNSFLLLFRIKDSMLRRSPVIFSFFPLFS